MNEGREGQWLGNFDMLALTVVNVWRDGRRPVMTRMKAVKCEDKGSRCGLT